MTDRANRILLALLGAALVGSGAIALLAERDPVGLRLTAPGVAYRSALPDPDTDPDPWLWTTLGIGSAVTALGVWWTARQFVRPGGRWASSATLDRRDTGQTTLDVGAVGRAAAADLEQIDAVRSAQVGLLAVHPPRLVASVELDADAEVRQVLDGVDAALVRVGEALARPDVEAEVFIDFAATATRVV